MTTLADRPNTALLVIDVPNHVVGETYERDKVIGNIAELVQKAWTSRVDVVWVAHNDDNLPPAARAGSTSPSWCGATPSGWCTTATETPSRRPTSSLCSPTWASARRPTSASPRRCTERSSVASTAATVATADVDLGSRPRVTTRSRFGRGCV